MPHDEKLEKGLGFIEVSSIAVGAMISSGLFILPGIAHAMAGPAVVFSYFLAGLLALTGTLSIAELATAMPKAGGDYFFISRGMGPAVGTVAGLLSWFALSLKSAFALVGMAAFTALIVDINPQLVGVALCVLFMVVNFVGVKHAGRLQTWFVGALLLLMLAFVVRGFPAVDMTRFSDFRPHGTPAVFAAVGLVFVSYGGLLKIASVSEEVRDPGRVIPGALIASFVLVIILYSLMVFVTSGVLDPAVLDKSYTPISDAAAVFMGRGGRVVFAIAAMLAFISTANAGIMAASRYLLALARDGLMPSLFAHVNRKRSTPDLAIVATGVLMIAALFSPLEILVKAASTVVILTYILANLSVIVLRESHVQNYQPSFKAPLYPAVQIAGIAGFAFILYGMGPSALLTSALLICGGFLVYRRYGRKTTDREYALLHLVERLTAKELVTGTLEDELKGIIRERDQMVRDRFDRMIERCVVMDIDESIGLEEFFDSVAERIAEATPFRREAIRDLLLERERESSTVLAHGLAIPHIVVEGDHYFDVLLVRCSGGVIFNEKSPPVHAVFVLFGTPDERNFHLRALAAIAQVVQDEDFEKRWLAARNEQALRDVVLLAERKRGA